MTFNRTKMGRVSMGKHHLLITENHEYVGTEPVFHRTLVGTGTERSDIVKPEDDPEFYRAYFGSIRNKVLQKFVFLWFQVLYGSPTVLRQKISAELKEEGYSDSDSNIVWALKCSDVQELIGCSERTAKEYLAALRRITPPL